MGSALRERLAPEELHYNTGHDQERREAVLPLAIGFGRNVGHCAALDLPADCVRVRNITLVRVQDWARRELRQKLRARSAIGDWPPASVNESGRHSASVNAWILVVRPPRERPIAWW